MVDAKAATKQLKSKAGYSISVTPDGTYAYLTLVPSELEEGEFTEQSIFEQLNDAGIVYGLLEDEIKRIVSTNVHDEKVLVAKGDPPVKGEDSIIEYLFDTKRKRTPKEDGEGRVDYKELNFIQNASAGDLLVKKTPSTPGEQGKSVFGKEIKALAGRDLKIPVGTNTILSEDGLELRANIDGSIVFTGTVVNIETVQKISGSVDASTGNIQCNGTLKVNKNVVSGFKVKVKGDLEINGHVEDAEIECDGNVIVKGGFFGNGVGKITAKGDVTIKWVDSQTIYSEKKIIVGGEVLNGNLFGKEGVIVEGSRGRIVGGEIASRDMIKAPVLGSDAGTTTNLKVAFDAGIIKKLKEIDAEVDRLKEDTDRVKIGLTSLYKLQISNALTPEKEGVLKKLEAFSRDVPEQMKGLEKKKLTLQNMLKEIQNAVIIGEKEVFPGVKAFFGVVYKEVNDTMGPTKFFMDYDQIMATQYYKAQEEAKAKAMKK